MNLEMTVISGIIKNGKINITKNKRFEIKELKNNKKFHELDFIEMLDKGIISSETFLCVWDLQTDLNTDLQSKQPVSTAITTQNIGQQSVNYATSAGTAKKAESASLASKASEAEVLIASNGNNRITMNWGQDGAFMYISIYVDGIQVAKIRSGFVG